jgi:hypothetical protein
LIENDEKKAKEDLKKEVLKLKKKTEEDLKKAVHKENEQKLKSQKRKQNNTKKPKEKVMKVDVLAKRRRLGFMEGL